MDELTTDICRLSAPGSVAMITGAGHFLQLERPAVVNARILEVLVEEAS